MLNGLLNSSKPRHRYEVVNAGVEGYNSTYALARLKEDVLPYEPDMVIIYIGWNDLMKVDPENPSETGKNVGLATMMERSYLMKAYRKLLFFYLRPLVLKPKLVSDESDFHAFDHFVPLVFQQNLERMIEILREKNIKSLLLTLPTVVSPDMTYEAIRRQNVVFPYYGGGYSVGRLLSLHGAYNNAIRRIASKHGVPVLDLDMIFNRHNKNELFFDTMHPNVNGQMLIAQSILDTVQAHQSSPEQRAQRKTRRDGSVLGSPGSASMPGHDMIPTFR